MLVEQFIGNLNNEIGYKFGSPWRYSDISLGIIVPILKIGYVGEREYLTLEEAKDQGIAFKDSGHIGKVIIESSLFKPIFIRSGTVLKSQGTQSRAVESSVIIVPKEEKNKQDITNVVPEIVITTQEIPVRCIYASKGIHTGGTFTYGGDVPLEVRSSLLSRSGQANTWAAVGNATHRLMSNRLGSSSRSSKRYGDSMSFTASHDNLAGVMEEVDKFTENIDEILKKVPLFEDQVGAVFFDMKNVVGIELFDHPKSWEAIHKEVEKRLGESVAKEEEKTLFKKPDYEQVKPLTLSFLKKLIDSEKIETSKSGDTYSVTFLKGDGIVGEATSINGKVIHLVGMKVDKNIKKDGGQTSTRASDILRSIGGPRIGSYRSSGNFRTTL